jgi:hypothetical protein
LVDVTRAYVFNQLRINMHAPYKSTELVEYRARVEDVLRWGPLVCNGAVHKDEKLVLIAVGDGLRCPGEGGKYVLKDILTSMQGSHNASIAGVSYDLSTWDGVWSLAANLIAQRESLWSDPPPIGVRHRKSDDEDHRGKVEGVDRDDGARPNRAEGDNSGTRRGRKAPNKPDSRTFDDLHAAPGSGYDGYNRYAQRDPRRAYDPEPSTLRVGKRTAYPRELKSGDGDGNRWERQQRILEEARELGDWNRRNQAQFFAVENARPFEPQEITRKPLPPTYSGRKLGRSTARPVWAKLESYSTTVTRDYKMPAEDEMDLMPCRYCRSSPSRMEQLVVEAKETGRDVGSLPYHTARYCASLHPEMREELRAHMNSKNRIENIVPTPTAPRGL